MAAAFLASLPGACVAPMDPARTGSALSAFIPVAALREAARGLTDRGFFLEDVTGLHVAEGFELDYFFSHWEAPGRIAVRVVVPADQAESPSLSDFIPGADWHERETADFLGVRFAGHPNPQPLLLPEDSTIHPLVREPQALRSLRDLLPPACFVADPACFAAEPGNSGGRS